MGALEMLVTKYNFNKSKQIKWAGCSDLVFDTRL